MSANDNVIPFDPRVPPDLSMTLGDYFAANAPAEIPNWYQPTLPTVDEQTRHLRASVIDTPFQVERLRRGVQDWRKDPCFDLEGLGETEGERKFLKAYEEAFNVYSEACAVARSKNEQARYFAWRWHYANSMLAVRPA